ncbi:uncharacterized protein LOC133916617 [Phragmites australis]|uniref:uncharacterized protein LOC133916617 n=1 Tax=Phragmites australis TaxID=29695 RepID=UPI002D76CEA1|nr:uncharacterized protein LOC133916617 [Phragmites australis]
MMTRARRRRLLAESSVRLGKKTSLVHPVAVCPEEWRDWANLMPELVDDISGRLLSFDVTEYLRFRAVCKPWRYHTDDPRARALDRRFRPRNWMVLSLTPDVSPRRRLLNLATAASLSVELPAFPTHCHLCAADGLLVLYHRATKAIRLLDPLSNAVTEFPAISRPSIVAAEPPSKPRYLPSVFREPLPRSLQCSGLYSIPHLIDGAGLDDSTSPPTLVLCLREKLSNIVFAKPGDTHWTLVSPGQASHWWFDSLGKVPFHSLLSLGGRCYFTSPEGSVYLLQLGPLPRLVEIVNQRQSSLDDAVLDEAIQHRRIKSFLVSEGSGGRMLMVRYLNNIMLLGGIAAYEPTELFTAGGITGRMELWEVDIAGRRLVPLRSLGRLAVFVGDTHCVVVSTKTFPSIAPDAIYLGYRNQEGRKFGVYHLSNRRTEPQHDFTHDEDYRAVPRARPCNLDQYLVCYVDHRHSMLSACINHTPYIHRVLDVSRAYFIM